MIPHALPLVLAIEPLITTASTKKAPTEFGGRCGGGHSAYAQMIKLRTLLLIL